MKKDSNINNRLYEPSLGDNINDWSAQEGFADFGIVALDDPALSAPLKRAQTELENYLAQNHHGTMGWMERPERKHPNKLWQEAKTAIVLAASYKPDSSPLELLKDKSKAAISVYAQGEDYHRVLGKKVKAIAQKIHHHYKCQAKTFIDTAPLMEKPIAALTGLGWQGKHSNLVSKELGSWFFLAIILLDIETDNSASAREGPHKDSCGSCERCLTICPTQAFTAPYKLDSRKCISYLTIEHKGHIARTYRTGIGNRIYGCDDCLAVCPWNKFAVQGQRMAAFEPNPKLYAPDLTELLTLNDEGFRERFRHNPIKRIGVVRFLRNVLIACGNSGDKSFLAPIENFIIHPDSLLRLAAVWACAQLADEAQWQGLKRSYQAKETDGEVLNEWRYRA